jgi:hypothetical protein
MTAGTQFARLLGAFLVSVILLTGTGCKQKASSAPSSDTETSGESTNTSGVAARSGSNLAYEIELQITLPAALIAPRLEALRKACEAQAVAQSCSLLSIEQQKSQGTIQMRAAPAAIESLTSAAVENGTVEERKIKAEDLTQALDDNALNSESLTLQHEKFKALLARPDVAVGDAITLARELSSLEASAQISARDRAALLRRVETNLLQISFTSPQNEGPEPGFWQNFSAAFSGFDTTLAEALSGIIIVLVWIVPLIFAMFPVVLIWRWLWRKLTGQARV